ncbi:MAG TPA: 16S rRNA (cytosine(1402)-N(4))-methyltransferase RsmH [Spirochaetia bacterium]|nr:16S rRNA (cytosine(1402)-N(4))-methyltransferase RsmH [Spirochaetia bacterium]
MDVIHYTVMGREVLQNLAPPITPSLLVDATLGEGGHSDLFLSQYPDLQVIGLDADADIIERARVRLSRFGDRVQFENVWFDDYFTTVSHGIPPALILFDLGISSYHYKRSTRGFSFQADEPLDMRLRRDSELSAANMVNSLSEGELADILFKFGEERYARRIVSRIVRERELRRIETTAELAEIVSRAVPAEYRHGRIHPATRTFQALRIAVNGELDRLERALPAAVNRLAPAGRIGVISFHSLEDRVVKTVFRRMSQRSTDERIQPTMKEGSAVLKLINKKPIRPAADEVGQNAASRSAKLRVAEKSSDAAPASLRGGKA